MKILKVILSKLRANNQSGYPDYKLRQVNSAYSYWFKLDLPWSNPELTLIQKVLAHIWN